MKLDEYEKGIEEALEAGEFKSVKNLEQEIAAAREMAENHTRKDQRMNIRISQRDLERIKSKAMEEGVPYQTLVTSVLHKYVSGKFKEEKDT
ncbi:MAG: antitoxin [Balneolaceae bacterium]|nr:MAG: antitoxin [Balneolaceae bacterium]